MHVCPCKRHEQHCEDCFMCRNFDMAVTQYMASFTTHPSQHIAVIGPQVREWADSLFPGDDKP